MGTILTAAALHCSAAFLAARAQTSSPASPPAASSPSHPAPVRSPAATSSAVASREVTDETGRSIRIPRAVRRIVSLAPSLTETLYALGLEDELVGDTDYCDYPPDARNKTKVGGAINPSLEAVVALHPDLVLVTKGLNRLETVTALAGLGIPSYATDPHSVADILTSTQRLADLLGVPATGQAIIRDSEHRLAEMRHRLEVLPQRRVLFVVWTEPLISVGKDTFIADALLQAGGVSIINSAQNWPQVSLEDVVRQQPEFLVFAESHSQGAPADLESLANRPGWRILDAVKNNHYALVSDAVNRPAVGIISAIEDLAKQLHPGVFTDKPDSNKGKGDPNNPAPFGAAGAMLQQGPSSLFAVVGPLAGECPPGSQEYPCAL